MNDDEQNAQSCKWLHGQLNRLRTFKWHFDLNELPDDGIYFFYEKGEVWGHGGGEPKIVRIGSCRNGNFKSRISEHYLWKKEKMNFSRNQAAPKDRSIFRKNIGRALLGKSKSDYLKIWNIDFTKKEARSLQSNHRNIRIEKTTEKTISKMLRKNYSFKCIEIKNQMGGNGLESRLIGTVAKCRLCKSSKRWLGQFSSEERISKSGLWQVQHLQSVGLNASSKRKIRAAIDKSCRKFQKA